MNLIKHLIINHVSDLLYLQIRYRIIDIAFDESLTNLRRVNHNEPLRAGQSNREFTFPSSRSGIKEQNAANKTGK